MDWLKENDYRTMNIDKLKGYMEKRFCPPGDNYVVLTFDDGLKSTYTQIYPILRDRGLTGISFLVGNKISFTRDQIKEMQSDGTLEFGSHLLTHNTGSTLRLEGISEETLKQEISTTNDILKDLTGKTITSLAWPGGAYNSLGVSLATKYGINMMFTVTLGPSSPGDSTYQIKRVGIYSTDSLEDFIQKVLNGR
jgi:peptidoglycan/xylan/chitin deacetylase (PgdA/CDA1 family)